MIEIILWLAVGLMVASSAIPRTFRVRKLVGGIGWGVFSIHWSCQPLHYLKIMDYANVLLTIVVTLFCLLVAYIMFREYKEGPLNIENNREVKQSEFSAQIETGSLDITSMLLASALGALVYFPFADFLSNTWIIEGLLQFWVFHIRSSCYMRAWNI